MIQECTPDRSTKTINKNANTSNQSDKMVFLLEVLISFKGKFLVVEGYEHSIGDNAGKVDDEPIGFFPGDDWRKGLFFISFHRLLFFLSDKRDNLFSFLGRDEEGSKHPQSKVAESYYPEGIGYIVSHILGEMLGIMINFFIIWIY